MKHVLILALLVAAGAARAETELSLYGGVQSAPDSDVSGSEPGGLGDFDFNARWEGGSLRMPPYWGVRATWWRTERSGLAFEINHAKVYADDDTREDAGFERLEFTNGLNLVTLNYMRRYPGAWGAFTPYWGVGAGAAVPHVDIQTDEGKTFGLQLSGPAAIVVAGARYDLSPSWSVFGEYKGSYSSHDVDLDTGGDLETEIFTNALNLGVSFRF